MAPECHWPVSSHHVYCCMWGQVGIQNEHAITPCHRWTSDCSVHAQLSNEMHYEVDAEDSSRMLSEAVTWTSVQRDPHTMKLFTRLQIPALYLCNHCRYKDLQSRLPPSDDLLPCLSPFLGRCRTDQTVKHFFLCIQVIAVAALRIGKRHSKYHTRLQKSASHISAASDRS